MDKYSFNINLGICSSGVAILIVSHLTVILAFLVSTIGLKYATIINASYHNVVFNMVQSAFPGVSMPADGAYS